MLEGLNTIRDQWNPPRDRVLWAPVFLGAGIALYFGVDREPLFAASCAVLATAIGILLMAMRRHPALVYPIFALTLIAAGFVGAQARTMMVHAPQLERQINFARVEGRVVDVTVSDEGKGKRRVTLDSLIIEKLLPEQTPRMVRLSTYHVPPDVVPGERIALLARLMPPSGPVAPDGFDYRRQAYFEGIGAVGFTMGKFERIAPAEHKRDIWFNELRRTIAQKISVHLPHPESAVTTALLAGERASIPDEVNDELRDSGLYHLLSISGLHVAIVCGVTFFVLRFLMALWPWMALNLPIKKMAAVAALGAGLFYSLLAGMPVPTQRAIFMTGLVLVAVMLDRSALSMRTIALAAFFVMIFHPEAVVGASFQLSFAAVLAMIAFHESAGRKIFIENRDAGLPLRAGLYVGSIVVTTLLVSVATMPPVLHHFGRLQIFGVLANALAIPLTSFIVMPAGMAALLLMPLGWEGPFLKIAGWGVDATLEVSHVVANLPHAALALPSMPLGLYVVSGTGFLLLCLWRGSFRWLGVPLMVVATVLGFFAARPSVMIDADGKSIGLKGDEIAYMLKTPTKFVRQNWLSVWGGTEVDEGKAIKDGMWQSGKIAINCDDFACRIVQGQHGLSIVRNRTVLFEECDWADAVISLDKATRDSEQSKCAGKLTSFWAMRDAGGVAFYAGDDGWRGRGMTEANKRRPWTMRRQSRSMAVETDD